MDTPTKPSEEADRFRAFAKQIVSVPKAVIDRREKELKARKAARKGGKAHA
jgi:hypothetical protein